MLRNELYTPWFTGEDSWGFEIISGDFIGVTVSIEALEFKETDDGAVELAFNIIKKPEDIDTTSQLFNQVVETIINDILREAVEAHLAHEQQNRTNDTEKSDIE